MHIHYIYTINFIVFTRNTLCFKSTMLAGCTVESPVQERCFYGVSLGRSYFVGQSACVLIAH